jgi:hypothetical protein
VNGRLQPIKNTASRGNARGRSVVAVKHAGDSRTLRLGRFDLRRAEGRKYSDTVSLLKAHLGGEVTAPQAILVDQSARLTVLTGIAWDELTKHGAFHDGEPTPALHAYLRLIGEARSVLVTLGLERRPKDVGDLQDYLRSKASKRLRLGRTLDAEDAEEA